MQSAIDTPATRPALSDALIEERRRNVLDGQLAGRNWAQTAQRWLVKNLADFVHANGGSWQSVQQKLAEGSATRPGSGLCSAITGASEDRMTDAAVCDFWSSVLGPDSMQRIRDGSYANAFLDSACEVWWESERQRETRAAQAAD